MDATEREVPVGADSPKPHRFWLLLIPALLLASACSEQTSAPAPAGAARRDIVGTGTKLYSQFDEELVIRDFFQDRRDGFYLDVGCAFAEHNSTTYYLEKHLGWTGIGVDAIVEYAHRWRQKRPRSRFFNLLVSDHSDTEDVFYRTEWPEVASAKKEMVEGKYRYEEIQVPTVTLDKLLEDNGVEKIDFLSMDIEGFQLTALAAFDIQKYRPELVCIEAYAPDQRALLDWFEERGYERIERYLKHDSINWYFTPAG